MAKNNGNLLIYMDKFRHAFIAEGADVPTNIESALNSPVVTNGGALTLFGASRFYRKGDTYIPSDHQEDCPTLNVNLIDFVYGNEDMVYNPNSVERTPVSILWGMRGLRHRPVGDVMLSVRDIPLFEVGDTPPEQRRKTLDMKELLRRRMSDKFVPLYEPRSDSSDANLEWASLFSGIPFVTNESNRILVNNKTQGNSYMSHSIYTGSTSKNFR